MLVCTRVIAKVMSVLSEGGVGGCGSGGDGVKFFTLLARQGKKGFVYQCRRIGCDLQ